MSDSLVKRINANFRVQVGIYQQMEQESRLQLEALQGGYDHFQIGSILDRRRQLLAKLDCLAQDNRHLQKEFLQAHGLKEFSLGQLKPVLPDGEWAILEQLITELGQVLGSITTMDGQSQGLMALREGSGTGKKAAPVGNQQARQAYKKAVQQKKETPG